MIAILGPPMLPIIRVQRQSPLPTLQARDSITETDIPAGLVLFKRKHHLSTNCIDDIIDLLESVYIPKKLSSWY